MILVGIDDTDMLDTPGTNHLARRIVQQLSGKWASTLVTRHQLLTDPRVPCTRKNGCVAIAFESVSRSDVSALAEAISSIMRPWCPVGSDPGLCVASSQVPEEVLEFGLRCKRELVSQQQARDVAAAHGILLQGLGGTQDGIIGALAAVGLASTKNDGRVIHVGSAAADHFHVSGLHRVEDLKHFGVDEVRRIDNGQLVKSGGVDVGKRLRPNYRAGNIVLFVSPNSQADAEWLGARVL